MLSLSSIIKTNMNSIKEGFKLREEEIEAQIKKER